MIFEDQYIILDFSSKDLNVNFKTSIFLIFFLLQFSLVRPHKVRWYFRFPFVVFMSVFEELIFSMCIAISV